MVAVIEVVYYNSHVIGVIVINNFDEMGKSILSTWESIEYLLQTCK